MDPTTLAAAAVGLLGPFFTKAAENIADTATEKIGALYQAVKAKFHGDAYQQAVLQGAEERPESQARLSALEGLLAETLEQDPEFAATLIRLVEETQSIQVTDSGAVAGRDVTMRGTYVAGRDLHIGGEL
jgi:hypothetical protein